MTSDLTPWILFHIFVFIMLAMDLGVFHRNHHEISFKEAVWWSLFWTALAGVYNVLIFFWKGHDLALQFLAGYLIERSLSFDNLFVFLVVLSYFKVPARFQHGVLFWGIIGALICRAVFIALGIALIERFHWMVYVLGAFLIVTGAKMIFQKDEEMDPHKNPILKLLKRFLPVTSDYHGSKFFVKHLGKVFATPLLVTLVIIETTDIIFAVESIPAVLAVSKDPFIVYTSNVFAILGLRALFFALAGFMKFFHHLRYGLAFILAFVGAKMLLSHICAIPVSASLLVIAGALALSVIASLLFPKAEAH